MTEFAGVLDLQVESLLTTLRAQCDVHCREIDSEADRESKQLIADSRSKLRQRMRDAVEEERRRLESALRDAHHRIETAERHRKQARYSQFLEDAWPHLVEGLSARWSDSAGRRAWCEMLINDARDKLAATNWTVEVPESWSNSDRRWLNEAFAARELPEPSCERNAGIVAGLRIRLGDACLDATLDGLLSHRRVVEARLLAAWERELARAPEEKDV